MLVLVVVGLAFGAWLRRGYLVNPLNDQPSAEWCRTAYQGARRQMTQLS